jgi:glutathione synthase/RimK-type ligase-like ATP-grasp enzyme
VSRLPGIVLVTCQEHPQLPEDDRRLFRPLTQRGFAVQLARWDDPERVWESGELLVLRAPWDYHLRLEEFLRWLDERSRQGTRVLNVPSVVRWNADKRYLLDLASQGIPIVETRVITSLDARLEAVLEEHGWDAAVLKPAVSAGAHLTVRFSRADAAAQQPTLKAILATGSAALVQPFLEEVQRDGEWSFLFFNRRFSHAVQKRAASGDFRVQDLFGGQSVAVDPLPRHLAAAQRVLEAVPGPLLYARVDGIDVQGELQLGELELIEPSLFLALAPQASESFADALVELAVSR